MMNPLSDTEVKSSYRPLFVVGGSAGRGSESTRVLMPKPAREMSTLRFMPVDGVPAEVEVEPEPAPDTSAEDRAHAVRVMIDAAREEASGTARRELEFETEARVRTERERMIEVCDRFVRDRQRYFAAAEEQVVRLALAIAARVLHQEASANPLVLTNAVRAALARVQDGSASVLRVPMREVAMWSGVFAPGSEPTVQITGDERMAEGACVLETVVGRVDLSIEVQLEEIARGFAEMVQGHPPRENMVRD